MKRRVLIRHIEAFGCILLKEGAKHSRYVSVAEKARQATIPRHREIDDFLARVICRQLGVPPP